MPRRTPLYDSHRALGARMVDFAGWEMPVQYSGILEEHAAVRTKAGIFDVSHMGEVEIRGPRALAACQNLTVNDVTRLRDGQAQYSVLCLPTGGVVDDIIVYRFAADRFFICVNAGNREVDFEWMRENAGGAEVVDRGDEFAQIAVQGPQAMNVAGALCGGALADLPSFHFIETEVAGCPSIVARTGYTGEDGCEIYCRPADAAKIWNALLEAGRPHGLQPAGLGARDTLRLEAALPLYGHELSRETTPLEARLGWVVKLDKGDFIGGDVLRRQKAAGLTRRLVGVTMVEPGIPRQGYRLVGGDRPIGEITSGTKSPTLGKAIGLGYVAADFAVVGTRVGVEIRNRVVAAEVVSLPFYKRT